MTTLLEDRGGPLGIAVDGANVYVANPGLGTVKRVGVAGGTATTLASGQGGPYGIAVSGASVYWANGEPGTANGGTLIKMPMLGRIPDDARIQADAPFGHRGG